MFNLAEPVREWRGQGGGSLSEVIMLSQKMSNSLYHVKTFSDQLVVIFGLGEQKYTVLIN